jgi:isoleucyl-tRNA synthetase
VYVRFPVVGADFDLLVWTTTPWTLISNVAAAVGQALRYVRVRQGDDDYWLGAGTLKTALVGPYEVVEERSGAEMAGWRYAGPFDDLPAVRSAFATGTAEQPDRPYEHVVVPWTEVGEDEGTGIVHIAPGCGAEDFQLGKALGLPVVAPLDESGIFVDGFGNLTGSDVREASSRAEPRGARRRRRGDRRGAG